MESKVKVFLSALSIELVQLEINILFLKNYKFIR